MKRTAHILLLGLLLLPAGLVAQTLTPADSLGLALLQRINSLRSQAGAPTVERHPMLDDLAQQHTQNMKDRQFLGHIDHNNETPQERKDYQYPELLGHVSELVGFDYGNRAEVIADRLMHTWLRKRKTRRLLLEPRVNYVGIGAVQDLDGSFATLSLGSLYAELVTEMPPDTVDAGSQWVLIYRYLSPLPRNQIQAILLFPYPDATKREKYVGILPTEPEWFDRYFRITLACDKGKGLYSFMLGTLNDLAPGGIVLEVTD